MELDIRDVTGVIQSVDEVASRAINLTRESTSPVVKGGHAGIGFLGQHGRRQAVGIGGDIGQELCFIVLVEMYTKVIERGGFVDVPCLAEKKRCSQEPTEAYTVWSERCIVVLVWFEVMVQRVAARVWVGLQLGAVVGALALSCFRAFPPLLVGPGGASRVAD